MAEHPISRPGERERLKQTLRFGFAIAGLLLCISAFSQPASGQPWPLPGIETPSRGWDYDGKRILGHIGHDICLWDAETGRLLHRMKGHKERIHAVQLSPDGDHALSSSWMDPDLIGHLPVKSKDTRVILWNLTTGRDKNIFKGQIAGEFSPDGKRIITYSRQPSEQFVFDAIVWEAITGRQLTKARLDTGHHPNHSRSLRFSPDGRHFVQLDSGDATLYSASDGRETGRVDILGPLPHYTSKGALGIATLYAFKLVDIESGRVIHDVEHDLRQHDRVAWTHDGDKVVGFQQTRRGDCKVKIWDIKSGKMITGAKNIPLFVQTTTMSPDDSRLAVRLNGGAYRYQPELGIYDMNTGKEIARTKFAKWGHLIGFARDSKTFLVGGSEFVMYDSENGKQLRAFNLLDNVDSSDWRH